jgi:hypothetical protein
MFYDSYDHSALTLDANCKMVRIYSGNKKSLLSYVTIEFPRILSHLIMRIFIHSHL